MQMGVKLLKTLTGQELIVFNLFFLGRGKAAFPDPTPKFTKKSYQFKWTPYANVYVTTLQHTELLHRPCL